MLLGRSGFTDRRTDGLSELIYMISGTISLPISLVCIKIILIQMSYMCQIAQLDMSSSGPQQNSG